MSKYLIGIFIFLHGLAYGTSSYFYSITEEDGLPSSEVYQIIQDKQGFIWIGCDAGLFRYDGVKFKPYRTKKQNSRSISNLYLDGVGRIWCKNFSGQVLCVKNNELNVISDFSSETGFYSTCYDEKNGFWKLTDTHIFHIDSLGKIISQTPITIQKGNSTFGADMIKWDEKIWVDIQREGAFEFDPEKKTLTKLQGDTLPNLSYREQRFFTWKNQLFLLRTEVLPQIESQIYIIDPQSHSMKLATRYINPSQVRNYTFYEDDQQQLWTATSVGSFCLIDYHLFTYPIQVCFFGEKITSVLKDREGNLWFSGLNNGVHIIPDLRVQKPNLKKELEWDTELRVIKNSGSGKFFFGTYTGRFGIADIHQQNYKLIPEINMNPGITVKDILAYKNKIYISRGRLFVYDTLTKKAGFPTGYSNARSMVLLNDTMFLLSPSSLVKIHTNNIIVDSDLKFDLITNIGGRDLVEDSKGIYASLNNGLLYYKDGKSDYIKDENEADIFAGNLSRAGKSIWSSTNDNGIIELRDGKFISRKFETVFNESNSIKCLYGESEELWISTNNYLYCYDIKRDSLFRLSKNIGIKASETYDITKVDHLVVLATKDGVLYFPDSIRFEKRIAPSLHLNSISTDTDTFKIDQNISLPYNFNNLNIEFTGIHFSSRKDLKYKYRVKEIDEKWTYTSYNNPRAIFTSLPSGSFTIEIVAVDEFNQCSKSLIIPIMVEAPLWQKGWFYFLSSLIVIALIILFYSLRIRSLRRKNDMEKKIISSQLTALKAQMNPHFMYNALNSIQDLVLSNDHLATNRYLGRFSQLMRKILNASGKESISIKEECEILNLYLELEKLRFGEEFNFIIQVDQDIDQNETMIPPMILQPYVENAMKHGLLHKKGNKQLNIQFNKTDHLICTIHDNGVGRKRSDEIKQRHHHSFASDATEKRLELLKNYTRQDFSIEITDLYDNGAATGTLVTIHFPH